MKKSILVSAFLLSTTLSLVNYVKAQTVAASGNMRGGQSSAALPTKLMVNQEAVVNSKVLKAFRRKFRITVPVQWSTDNKLYLACFEKDSIQYRVTYRSNGQLVQTLKKYSARHLDKEIKAQVDESYDGYDITGATEIITGQEKVYFVNIESRRKLKELIIYNGDVSLKHEYMLQ